MRTALIIPAILSALIASASTEAADNSAADWPCEQRKVRHLSWGQMWTGPELPAAAVWREDETVARLGQRLAARRTLLDDAPALVDAAGVEGGPRLAALFAAAFAQIDAERARLVDGIGRFARKQQTRAARIDAMRGEIEARSKAVAEDDFDEFDAIEALEDDLAWETRIYQDRRRSLAFVCESPVTLEKRAFALARLIQARLP